MSLDLNSIKAIAPAPEKRSRLGLRLGVVAVLVALSIAAAAAWNSGYRPAQAWEPRREILRTVNVDQGELAVFINETGTLESAANTTVRCQVEALIGAVGGTSKAQTGGRSTGAASSGGGTAAASGPAGGAASGNAAAKSGGAASKSTSKSSGSAKKKGGGGGGGGGSGGGSGGAGSGGGSGGGAGSGSTGGGGGGGGGGSGGGSSGGGGASGGGGGGGGSGGSSSGSVTAPVAQRPTIRSFSYSVPNYVSLRPSTKSSTTAVAKSSGGGNRGGGGGGGGGGGNRGGGGGGGGGGGTGGDQEKAGSTRIIMIKPEGTEVTTGELVCELDSAAYRDELIAQRIRFDQAKAWVVQARSILEVNEISLREYRDGIYKQDLQLVRQYLSSCRTEEERASRNLTWSKGVYAKGFRAPAQYQADILALDRAVIALGEAERMERRLVDFTGPKLIKSLEAKLEANRADVLAQESAFQLESDRLRRLERTVEHCTLRAPHDGIVVYSMPAGAGWGPPKAVIMEGATVREGQAIFELPDAKKMRVRARINESKVGSVHVGQRASIKIDAFPDKPLDGTVTEVTAIPAPNGMGSDIRIYYANVVIDSGGFEGLRPGLSAEVSFFVEARPEATRVPLQAVRWFDNIPYAAVTTSSDQTTWRWQQLQVGLMNEWYAEILGGLKPGEKVVAAPEALAGPPPEAAPVVQATSGGNTPRG